MLQSWFQFSLGVGFDIRSLYLFMLFLVFVVYFHKKTSNESQLNMMTSLLVLCADDSSWTTVWSNNSWDNRSSLFSHRAPQLVWWSGRVWLSQQAASFGSLYV